MATIVCDECSCEVPAGSELCPECGFPVTHVESELCPECQNLVVFADGVCPECGFPKEEPLPRVEPEPAAPETDPEAPEAAAPPSPSPAAPPAADLAQLGTEELLRLHVASLNDLKGELGSVKELVARSGNGNNDMLGDLITCISNFVSSSEQIKNDMIAEMREQSETTLQGVREVANSFTGEMKTAAEGVKEAQKAAVGEINAAVQQAKAASGKDGDEGSAGGDKVDYLFYLCGVLLLFTVLNMLVTAYVARMVK